MTRCWFYVDLNRYWLTGAVGLCHLKNKIRQTSATGILKVFYILFIHFTKYFAIFSKHRRGHHQILVKIFWNHLALKKNARSYIEETEINYTALILQHLHLQNWSNTELKIKSWDPEKIPNSPCIKNVFSQHRKNPFIASIYLRNGNDSFLNTDTHHLYQIYTKFCPAFFSQF
jgi:hypothetical protein